MGEREIPRHCLICGQGHTGRNVPHSEKELLWHLIGRIDGLEVQVEAVRDYVDTASGR